MIDRPNRDRLAEKLRHLVSGRITNEHFNDSVAVASKQDPAIAAIFWNFADGLSGGDLFPYRLRGRNAVPPEVRRIAARVIVFLHSDFEYEYEFILFEDVDWVTPFGFLLAGGSLYFAFVSENVWLAAISGLLGVYKFVHFGCRFNRTTLLKLHLAGSIERPLAVRERRRP